MADPMLVAKGENERFFLPRMANRHGLVAGATGTGKTVTLQVMAERLSKAGVPVFVADIKGDLSGISQAGTAAPRIKARIEQLALGDYPFSGCPVVFWDVYGEQGHPVRATISEMGPLLLSRLLNLNDTQSGVLTLAFKVADDNGLLLLDLKDLRALLQHIGENAKQFTTEYGNISAASVGAIQRGLLGLDQQGADDLFGEPALDLMDFIQTDSKGHGVINILAADKLIHSPLVYATFLLWMLSELFERLPEVGDLDKPKLVFFFDEAHLLFNDAPTALVDKIEQLVRLIRSKGIGVYFVTQNPLDVPDKVLGQLGNRVQHALRAFTPRDQKAVRSAAETFRQNPKLNVEEVITQLGVGEALVSFLDEKGIPSIVDRAFVLPPWSQIGPITADQRKAIVEESVIFGHYEAAVDRESAYEILKGRADTTVEDQAKSEARSQQEKQAAFEAKQAEKLAAAEAKVAEREAAKAAKAAEVEQRRLERELAAERKEQEKLEAAAAREAAAERREQERREAAAARERAKEEAARNRVITSFATSAARTVGSTLGRSILRGVLGGILGGSRK